jgi:hypothetical protein
MTNDNMGILVAKRVAYSALILAGITGLFMGLSAWQYGSTNLDWRVWSFIGFWAVSLAIDTYAFASRNAADHAVVHYENIDSAKDALDAIVQALGYEPSASGSATRLTYTATYMVGKMNRPVTIDMKSRRAEITGPSFAIRHIENRLENLNYIDLQMGEGVSVPLGSSATDYEMQSGLGNTASEVFKPRTA